VGRVNEENCIRTMCVLPHHFGSITFKKGDPLTNHENVENTTLERCWIPARQDPTPILPLFEHPRARSKDTTMIHAIFEDRAERHLSAGRLRLAEHSLHSFRREGKARNFIRQPFPI